MRTKIKLRQVNPYWPVYKNIESQFIDLTYNIHFSDDQLNVYSPKIAELILRCAVEIESISKELYLKYCETPIEKMNPEYDYVCLKFLIQLWILQEKVVYLDSSNVYITKNVLQPLKYNAQKKKGETFKWNLNYQDIKHNRVKNIKVGNIENLIDIMSALYLLNIYYRDDVFDQKTGFQNFDLSLGSGIFSIKLHWITQYLGEKFVKSSDFNQCIYYQQFNEETEEAMNRFNDLYYKNKTNPKYIEDCSWAKNIKYVFKLNKNNY